jgi:VanZ family protein
MPGPESRPRSAFWVQVVPALLYVVAVFLAGTSPKPPDIPLDFSQRDKVLHLLVFGGMSVLIWRALHFGWPAARLGRQLLVAAGTASLLGALLEVWQSFVPGRSMELLDWVADAVGAALATWVAYLLAGRSRAARARIESADGANRGGEPAGQGLAEPASRLP